MKIILEEVWVQYCKEWGLFEGCYFVSRLSVGHAVFMLSAGWKTIKKKERKLNTGGIYVLYIYIHIRKGLKYI
jgi:hypothetical protein